MTRSWAAVFTVCVMLIGGCGGSGTPPIAEQPVNVLRNNGDLIEISIDDLVGVGVTTTKQTRVDHDGNISLPLVGKVRVEGMTEAEAEQAISKAYNDAKLIRNAKVSVTIIKDAAAASQPTTQSNP
ncbi:hypothetical protein BH10PLA1_BH10PLA1_12120 [soil metagenome]